MSKNKAIIALLFVFGLFLWSARPAHAYGPPPGKVEVSCVSLKVDPPSVSWIGVTFHGTDNGGAFAGITKYGSPVPKIAVFSWKLQGHHVIHMMASWTLGPGNTAPTDVTLDCGGGSGMLPFTGGWINRALAVGAVAVVGGTTCLVVSYRKRHR